MGDVRGSAAKDVPRDLADKIATLQAERSHHLSELGHPPTFKEFKVAKTDSGEGWQLECLWCQWGGRPIRSALCLKANGSGVQKWYLDNFKVHTFAIRIAAPTSLWYMRCMTVLDFDYQSTSSVP